jgi:hypothetical protein
VCEPGLVDVSGGDGEHRLDGLVDIGLVVRPGAAVDVDEQHEARPRGALVAVGKRMVPCDAAGKTAALSYGSG